MMNIPTLLSLIPICLCTLQVTLEGKYVFGSSIRMMTVLLITGRPKLAILARSMPKEVPSRRLHSILMETNSIAKT